MKNHSILRILMAAVLIGFAARAAALPFSAFDPRSLAMGGTGVASATAGNASFYNPALLSAAFQDDHFAVELPIAKAEYYDPHDLRTAAQDFNNADYVNQLSAAINQYQVNPNASTGSQVVQSANNLINGLNSISGKEMQLDLDAALVVARPSHYLGLSLYINAWVLGGGVGHFAPQDQDLLKAIINSASQTLPVTDPKTLLKSSVNARLAGIAEVGVSVSRQVNLFGQTIALGITPKFVRVQTYDYLFTGANLDNARISLGDNRKINSNLNLDLGIAKEFGDEWRAGFTVKNLFSHTYRTVLGNALNVGPQVRVGAVHHNSWSTVAADLDLTQNDPAGFDAKTRFLGLGAEFDAWHYAQLRVGYRLNIAATRTSIFTGGIGISPFGVHLDLAIAGNANEIAAAAQTGFRF